MQRRVDVLYTSEGVSSVASKYWMKGLLCVSSFCCTSLSVENVKEFREGTSFRICSRNCLKRLCKELCKELGGEVDRGFVLKLGDRNHSDDNHQPRTRSEFLRIRGQRLRDWVLHLRRQVEFYGTVFDSTSCKVFRFIPCKKPFSSRHTHSSRKCEFLQPSSRIL